MNTHRHRFFLISVFLIAAVIAVYWPVYKYDFVDWDDNIYVTENPNVQKGLNFESIRWAFTTNYSGTYHPVTWLSHILDWQLFKSRAGGHHITNVLFHIANTLILFYVLMRMTGAVWPAAFVAAAFALHPLHVESVAWVSERKDVLSTFWGLLAILAYSRYVENRRFKWYLVTLVLFVPALMSKPMLVTLPFVLLLLDFWPLQRKFSYRLLTEKIPFIICSIIICFVTVPIQQKTGAVASLELYGLATRINNAFVSYVTYIIKMFRPGRLTVLYLHCGKELPVIKAAVCGVALFLFSVCFIYPARRYKFLAVGWLWYLGMLVPVIGLVQSGAQAVADRYTYMTLTGLFIIIAWSAKEFVPKRLHKMLVPAAVAILIACGIASARQLKCWQNSRSLFEQALRVDENNNLILYNYIIYLNESGRYDEAAEKSDRLLKITPDDAKAHNVAGTALMNTGRLQQALEHFESAIKNDPNFLPAYFNASLALTKQDKLQEAAGRLEQSLKLKPDSDLYIRLAMTYISIGKSDSAVETCNRAIELEPNNAVIHGYRGLALQDAGRSDEAIEEFRFVLKVNPDNIVMHRNLGSLLERQGKIDEAIESYRAALQIEPDNEGLRQLLEEALKKQKTR